ncbi:hypothetical protein BB561_006586 [Smittium simulii]|uniref:Uncharacterized protein n=1 Tax=Smittium simulii TaxID=133385 RepID=A0A2T9Y314_9FUNG|nr:hypothetical protein BB561_006586 [Smittium simulii]
MSTKNTESYIGLNIGNYNSVIAVLSAEKGVVDVIANEDGDHKTPTYLAFADSELYSGTQAKHQSIYNHSNTIVGFLETLGKGPEASPALADFFCKFTKGDDGSSHYLIAEQDGSQSKYSSYQILVKFLTQLKNTASQNLGCKIDGAVLSLHSSWSQEQVSLFTQACKEADLPVLQLIDETSAAILATDLLDSASDDNVIVVNVGATKTDLSLVNVRLGLELPVAKASTEEFSGEKVDNVLMSFFADEFKRSSSIDVIANNKNRELLKLKYGVETTKHTISNARTNSASVPCTIESLSNGFDFNSKITKLRFEMLCNRFAPVLEKHLLDLLQKSKYSPLEISKVLFVGGSAEVSQKLISKIMSMFPNATKVEHDHSADEMIAVGCANQAHLIHIAETVFDQSSPSSNSIENIKVLASPVGLKLSEDSMITVLSKNTPLPAVRDIFVNLPKDLGSTAYFAICEGKPNVMPPQPEESEEDDDDVAEPVIPAAYSPSNLLAEFSLDLPESTKDKKIKLSFHIDINQKLTVTAKDTSSNTSSSIEI